MRLVHFVALVLFCFIAAVIFIPVVARRNGSRIDSCLSDLHALVLATQMYVADHGRYPNAATWMDDLSDYLTNPKQTFHCPSDKGHTYSYAMNAALSGLKPPDPRHPPHVILFFSSVSGKRNASGDPARDCRPHRGERPMCSVAYADGDAEVLAPRQGQ